MSDKCEKITHLISLQHFIQRHINDFGYFELKARYEALLNKVVEKGMFVACDLEGNILKEPSKKDMEWFKGLAFGDFSCDYTRIFEYVEAKERILFEGWTYDYEDEYLVFKICESEEWLLDFEEIKDLTLRDLVFEELKLSQAALNEIYTTGYETN